jgi:hypothetical protein
VRHPQRLTAHPLRRFGQPRRRLRAGLARLLFAVAGLGLGLLLPRITLAPTVAVTFIGVRRDHLGQAARPCRAVLRRVRQAIPLADTRPGERRPQALSSRADPGSPPA